MPPNILWIVTTQWRGQALGGRDPNARTPALDALAGRGCSFRHAVTPHPFGPFARAAMLTGIPSPGNGVRGYFDPLPASSVTIAHRMAERGYATAFFGKWHLASRDPSAPLVGEAHAVTPVPESGRGSFAFWEGFESGFLINDPYLQGTGLAGPTRFPGYQSDVVCSRAAGRLGTLTGPWFAVVSLEPPHPPYGASASGIAPRDPGSIVLASNVPASAASRARADLAGYYAHIEATDRAIGRLVEAVGEEVAVVVTSVHGDMHGAHGLFRKGWPHEESIRVPLVARGFSGDGVVSLLDLPAITLALAEGRPADCGRDHAHISMPSVVALPDQCDRAWRGVRTRQRKLVLGEDGRPWLFFNLERDPCEQNNLVADPAFAGEIGRLARLCG
jgi:arylsulfatase A-like enzyme